MIMMLLQLVHNQPCTISSKMRLFGQCPGNDCSCKHDNNEDVSNLVDVVTNNIGKEWLFPSCHAYPFIRYGYFAYLHIVSSCYHLKTLILKIANLKKAITNFLKMSQALTLLCLRHFFSKRTFWAVRCTKYAARILKCV